MPVVSCFRIDLCCDAASASASGVPGSSFGGCERFDFRTDVDVR